MKVTINAKDIGQVVNIDGKGARVSHNAGTSASAPPADPPIAEEIPVAEELREELFISYSHRDADWLARFKTALAPLQHSGAVCTWCDHDIVGGDEWQKEIDRALAAARAALLLVSKEFLASEYIMKYELPRLVAAREKRHLRLVWVRLDHCTAKHYPDISKLQALHDVATPLCELTGPALDRVLCAVTDELVRALKAGA